MLARASIADLRRIDADKRGKERFESAGRSLPAGRQGPSFLGGATAKGSKVGPWACSKVKPKIVLKKKGRMETWRLSKNSSGRFGGGVAMATPVELSGRTPSATTRTTASPSFLHLHDSSTHELPR